MTKAEYQKEYQKKNKEILKIKKQIYYENNKSFIVARASAWNKENSEKRK